MTQDSPRFPVIRATWLLFVFFGLAYQSAALRPAERYRGFAVVRLEPGTGCDAHISDSPPFISLSQISVGGSGALACETKLVPVQGNRVIIEYSNEVKRRERVEQAIDIEGEDGALLERIIPIRSDSDWHARAVDLPSGVGRVRLRFRTGDHSSSTELRIRSRINFIERSTVQTSLRRILGSTPFSVALVFGLGVILALVLLAFGGASGPKQYAVLLLTTILVHYRPFLMFAFDEWHLLDRIAQHGAGALLISHNEHFIPVAVLLSLVESSVFGGWYDGFIAVSLFLHAGTALAVSRLMERLLTLLAPGESAERRALRKRLAFLIGGLFALNGLHAEVLQWCMCQGSVLAALASTMALCRCWDFVAESRRQALMAACAWATVAILSFAGAFAVIIQGVAIGALAGYRNLLRNADLPRDGNANRTSAKSVFQIVTILATSLFVTVALNFALYRTARESGGLRFSEPHIAPLGDLLRYTFVGTQFGTIVRGTGLVPGIGERFVETSTPRFVRESFPLLPKESGAIGLGVAVSLLLLALALCRSPRDRDERGVRMGGALLWIVGQVLVILPFALTSVARASFGVDYAVRSLRYQTPALLGLMLMLGAPLLMLIDSRWPRVMALSVRRRSALNVAVIGSVIAAQLWFVLEFNSFRDNGAWARIYLAELADWETQRTATDPAAPFEGAGESRGNYPVLFMGPGQNPRAFISPLHPLDILRLSRHGRDALSESD